MEVPVDRTSPGGKTGCPGNTGRPSRVLSLNPASGALQGLVQIHPCKPLQQKRKCRWWLSVLATTIELSGIGLSTAQRTNPLTMIVADAGYPESVLSPVEFELFREATLHALASNWLIFETSFCKGRVLIFVASNPQAKGWLNKTVAELSSFNDRTAYLRKSRRRGRLTGGIRSLRNFVKKPEDS